MSSVAMSLKNEAEEAPLEAPLDSDSAVKPPAYGWCVALPAEPVFIVSSYSSQSRETGGVTMRSLRRLILFVAAAAMSGNLLAAEANAPGDSSAVADSSAAASPRDDGFDFRVFYGLPTLSSPDDWDVRYGNIDLRYTSFAAADAMFGYGIEGGFVGLVEGLSEHVVPVLPYAEAGPVLRAGDFTVEGNLGLLVLLPYVSATLAYRVPVGNKLGIVVESGGLAPLYDVGGLAPDPFVYVGCALSIR
jgi:hypothetical protein